MDDFSSLTLVRLQERREVRRCIRVDCQVVRESDFRLIASRGMDVSADGMLAMAQEPAVTGEAVIVSFRLPMTNRWFDAEASVARIVHGRRPWDRGRCLALQFDRMNEQDRHYLRHVLRRVPPPLPARARRVDYAASLQLAMA